MASHVSDLEDHQKSPISLGKNKRYPRRYVFLPICILLGGLIYRPLLGNLILRAADRGDAAQVKFLLRIGAEPDSYGWYIPNDQTPLMLSAAKGSLPTVRLLLDHGADVNTGVNEWSVTPLMCAVEGGNPSVVRLLIAKGAHLNDIDGSADSPLTLARADHRTDIIQILKSAGAQEMSKK